MTTFKLKDSMDENPPYIELNKLLKVMQISQSGAMSNKMIEQGMVQLNGNPESRKRAKIRKGDVVTVGEQSVEVA